MNFVKMIDPSLVADYKSNHPTFYSPLAAAINVMSAYPTSKPLLEYSDPVSKPSTPETIDYLGEWVWKQGFELKEGMSDLIGPVGYTPESRKKYFNNESNRNQIIFKKDMIYNFEV